MKRYTLLILVLCATQGHAVDIGIQPQEEGFEAQERDETQNFSEEIQAIERKIANAMGPILEMRRAQEIEEALKKNRKNIGIQPQEEDIGIQPQEEDIGIQPQE